MTTASEMQVKVDAAITNMDRIDDFVNGGPTETVTLEGGEIVPTIQKIAADSGYAADTGRFDVTPVRDIVNVCPLYVEPVTMSDLKDTVIDEPAGTVKSPAGALNVTLPCEIEAESVNLFTPLYR